MAAARFGEAVEHWRAVTGSEGAAPGDWLNLATALRLGGDLDAALAAVDGALRFNPRLFLALLMRASLLERAGRLREAGPAYGDAILQAPHEATLDPATRQALAHGREVNRAYGDELASFIRERAGVSSTATGEARRVDQFVDHLLGRRKPYPQAPLGYYYPGLPAIEFWDREEFPWLEDLEAAREAITQECAEVAQAEREEFEPYIDYKDSLPLDQWAALNRSEKWGAYHLLKDGQRVEKHARRCPRTLAVLAGIPQPVVPSRSPNAMFSALAGRTHIPPHTGVSNARLVCHLPLIVPEGCRFRVGNDVRTYADGKAFVFDDCIEHEAFNDSDELRIILLFDVWNPRLSEYERQMIAEVSARFDEFNGGPPGSDHGL